MTESTPEATEAVARLLYARDGYAPWKTEDANVQEDYRIEAASLVAAALPHLRVQETRPDRLREKLAELHKPYVDEWDTERCDNCLVPWPCDTSELLAAYPTPAARPVVDREALATLAADWRQSADEDERYLNTKVHASEVHDVMASVRINREHADAILALLPTEEDTKGASHGQEGA